MGWPMPGLTQRKLSRAIISVIVEARGVAGLSQRELSERLELASNYVQRLESSARIAPTYQLMRIAYALGMSASEFMARVERRL
jgi:transcriptional regulator with XRE-family HTH domain